MPTHQAAETAELIRTRDKDFVWHPWSPIDVPGQRVMADRASGLRLWDVDGVEYLDASSLNATVGYAHPAIVAAAAEQLARLHGLDISVQDHIPAGRLAERLARLLPGGLTRTLFTNSGSRGHRGERRYRRRLLGECRQTAHQDRDLRQGISRLDDSGAQPVRAPAHRPPLRTAAARQPRRPAGTGSEGARTRDAGAVAVRVRRRYRRRPGRPTDGRAGRAADQRGRRHRAAARLPHGVARAVRHPRSAADPQRGLHRDRPHGCHVWFSARRDRAGYRGEQQGPDGGYAPIAAVTVQERIYETFKDNPVIGGLRYGHTTSGHPVACAAAMATLDVVERQHLVERSRTLGAQLLEQLKPLEQRPSVVDVRGLGLLAVFEMATPEQATALVDAAQRQRLLLRQQGRAVMAVPPLSIDSTDLGEIIARVTAAVDEVDD